MLSRKVIASYSLGSGAVRTRAPGQCPEAARIIQRGKVSTPSDFLSALSPASEPRGLGPPTDIFSLDF